MTITIPKTKVTRHATTALIGLVGGALAGYLARRTFDPEAEPLDWGLSTALTSMTISVAEEVLA